MGIWIRSQNKCKMVQCVELYVDDSYDGDYDIEGYTIDDTPIILGTYSTKEKAIKVLDMIQECINPHVEIPQTNIIDIDDLVYRPPNVVNIDQPQIALLNNVFQMPQDNEVEV